MVIPAMDKAFILPFWVNMFKIIYNKRKTIMVHSYQVLDKIVKSKFVGDTSSNFILDLILDNNDLNIQVRDLFKDYIITFDDGLYQQIEVIKLFKQNPIFFPSFGLLRPENISPNPIENSIAHSMKKIYLSTFMSSTEVWDLVHSGAKLGMHGWYHLNLNLNHSDINTLSTLEKYRLFKEDARKCAEAYSSYITPIIDQYIVDGELELYFCTPYNCLNNFQKDYINLLCHYLNINFAIDIPKKLIVFSNERTSIENFIKDIQNAII